MERLRGNTFLLLLLRAGRTELSAAPEYGESKDGITKPNMLADLIRLTKPSYDPPKLKTLGEYFSQYLDGSRSVSPKYYPFNTPEFRYGLCDRCGTEYDHVLSDMDQFCHTYLDLTDRSLRLLVSGLVDAILRDDTFTGRFDIGDKWVEKGDLDGEDKFILQPFLVSVWASILENHPDASEGGETYLAWTTDAGYNTARTITTAIGAERAKKIAVSTDLPDWVKPEEAAEEIAEETTEEIHDEEEPRVEVYEAPYTDPHTQKQVLAQFKVEAHDNGVAIGQVFGGLVIGKRGKDE